MADVLGPQEREELRVAMTQPRISSSARMQAAAAYAAVAPAFERIAAAEDRYDRENDLDGLDEALRTFESVDATRAWRALAADRRADWERRVCLIYRKRYEETGAEDDLRRAVAAAGAAAEAAAAASAAAGDVDDAMNAVAALVMAHTAAHVEATLPQCGKRWAARSRKCVRMSPGSSLRCSPCLASNSSGASTETTGALTPTVRSTCYAGHGRCAPHSA